MSRRFWVMVHRYTGLAMTVFLVITALTGSLLAFNSELEHVFAPNLFAGSRPGQAPLELAELAERAQLALPQVRVLGVTFTEFDQVQVGVMPPRDPDTNKPRNLGFTQLFIDPWTGQELGRRLRGDLTQGAVNVMPFLYQLHFNLSFGPTGQVVLGVVALVWTLDCFIALYLTLPTTWARFMLRWKTAWSIKPQASTYRLNVDLHRASGLWLWPLLFIFAWSSVMFNIRPTYEWITGGLFDYRSPISEYRNMPKNPVDQPRLDWRAAEAAGRRLVAQEAVRVGFSVAEPLGLAYMPAYGLYRYEVRGSRDLFERAPKGGSTYVMFDGNTGELKKSFQPTGQHTGNTIDSWLYALHMCRIFGRPFQVVVFALGLVITMLGVTGVYIWWVKRRAAAWGRVGVHALRNIA
jgi:uncharacterized iron-regulated membrane protein